MISIVFYDYEVFKYDWLVVLIDIYAQKETVIVNDPAEMRRFYDAHKSDILPMPRIAGLT